jgi:hypothetical protein
MLRASEGVQRGIPETWLKTDVQQGPARNSDRDDVDDCASRLSGGLRRILCIFVLDSERARRSGFILAD